MSMSLDAMAILIALGMNIATISFLFARMHVNQKEILRRIEVLETRLQNIEVQVLANHLEMVRRFDQIDLRLDKIEEEQNNFRRRLGDIERTRGVRR